ncbi:MAG: GtrA family protein [Actinomycetota bacterium]|nr:GtrA family protein [Actinomycetota bacterium]
MTSLVSGLYQRFQVLVHELAKFGIVGACCAAIDIGGFNLLHFAFHVGPLTSKAISTVVAATCAYIGNRNWSFRHRARTGVAREYTLFFVLNTVGLAIALSCLAITRYGLGLKGALALNISANVVGLGLGTIFRFWAYKRFVFLHPDVAAARAVVTVSVADAPAREPAGSR